MNRRAGCGPGTNQGNYYEKSSSSSLKIPIHDSPFFFPLSLFALFVFVVLFVRKRKMKEGKKKKEEPRKRKRRKRRKIIKSKKKKRKKKRRKKFHHQRQSQWTSLWKDMEQSLHSTRFL
jgi:hypothetical protein